MEGSPVSYKGVTYTLGDCAGNLAGKPITAFIHTSIGKKKSMKFEDLRPLGSHRTQKLFPRGDDEYTAGDFLFFDIDDQVFSGKVLSVSDMQITVHDHDFDEHKDTWYPLYMAKGLATAAYSKPKDCPASTRGRVQYLPCTSLSPTISPWLPTCPRTGRARRGNIYPVAPLHLPMPPLYLHGYRLARALAKHSEEVDEAREPRLIGR